MRRVNFYNYFFIMGIFSLTLEQANASRILLEDLAFGSRKMSCRSFSPFPYPCKYFSYSEENPVGKIIRNFQIADARKKNYKLKIWGRRSAFNVQKVMWLIGELSLAYEHIPAGGSFDGLNTLEFLAMNPHGRVPVILDGETVVWESHAILRYLAARYGYAQFWSDDADVRSQIDQWMDWSQTTLQPDFLTGVFWGFYRTPESQRDWPTIREKIGRCNKHFQLLDSILKIQPFLCGNTITLADITTGTSLYRYFELEIDRPTITNVEAWYKRLQERPSYREHVMIPFDNMQGCLDY